MLLVLIAAVPLLLLAQRGFTNLRQQQFENLSRQAEQQDELLGPECRRRLAWLAHAASIDSLSVAAFRTGRTKVLQSIAREPGSLPWRETLLKRGFGSAASMPLKAEDVTIGTFTLFAAETDAFDKEGLEPVRERADDLAFGIGGRRERIRHVDAEREARRVATRDGLGYAPGTQAFREIADRLRRIVPEGELVARVPRDDVVMLRADVVEYAAALAADLLKAFATPVTIDKVEIDVQGHAGASLYPGHGDEPDMPLAEQTGLIRQMTYLAVETAIRRLRAWLDEGLLATWGVPGELLEFEITEGARIGEPQTARAVVSSVTSMGQQLGLRVVAEGVEQAQERDTLIAMGRDEAQGYLFGPAVGEDELLGLLKQRWGCGMPRQVGDTGQYLARCARSG